MSRWKLVITARGNTTAEIVCGSELDAINLEFEWKRRMQSRSGVHVITDRRGVPQYEVKGRDITGVRKVAW